MATAVRNYFVGDIVSYPCPTPDGSMKEVRGYVREIAVGKKSGKLAFLHQCDSDFYGWLTDEDPKVKLIRRRIPFNIGDTVSIYRGAGIAFVGPITEAGITDKGELQLYQAANNFWFLADDPYVRSLKTNPNPLPLPASILDNLVPVCDLESDSSSQSDSESDIACSDEASDANSNNSDSSQEVEYAGTIAAPKDRPSSPPRSPSPSSGEEVLHTGTNPAPKHRTTSQPRSPSHSIRSGAPDATSPLANLRSTAQSPPPPSLPDAHSPPPSPPPPQSRPPTPHPPTLPPSPTPALPSPRRPPAPHPPPPTQPQPPQPPQPQPPMAGKDDLPYQGVSAPSEIEIDEDIGFDVCRIVEIPAMDEEDINPGNGSDDYVCNNEEGEGEGDWLEEHLDTVDFVELDSQIQNDLTNRQDEPSRDGKDKEEEDKLDLEEATDFADACNGKATEERLAKEFESLSSPESTLECFIRLTREQPWTPFNTKNPNETEEEELRLFKSMKSKYVDPKNESKLSDTIKFAEEWNREVSRRFKLRRRGEEVTTINGKNSDQLKALQTKLVSDARIAQASTPAQKETYQRMVESTFKETREELTTTNEPQRVKPREYPTGTTPKGAPTALNAEVATAALIPRTGGEPPFVITPAVARNLTKAKECPRTLPRGYKPEKHSMKCGVRKRHHFVEVCSFGAKCKRTECGLCGAPHGDHDKAGSLEGCWCFINLPKNKKKK